MTREIITTALPSSVLTAPGFSAALPALIGRAGYKAAYDTVEFFTARSPNPNTRRAYGRAVAEFCAWAEDRQLELAQVAAPHVGLYVQELAERYSPASVNLSLSGLRQWFDWLNQRGTLATNPAFAVKGIRSSTLEGKTPILERDQARALFDSFEGKADIVSLRDRAMIAVMLYGFVRVGALVKMRAKDFEDAGGEATLILLEKGGKSRRIPCHHLTRQYIREYLAAAGELERKTPLFQSAPRKAGGRLSGLPLSGSDVWDVVKRRCKVAGLPASISNHSFRATGITIHQENGGRLEDAAMLAGHADLKTTQLYNRKARKVARAEVERVQL